jgi:hypothetical protein
VKETTLRLYIGITGIMNPMVCNCLQMLGGTWSSRVAGNHLGCGDIVTWTRWPIFKFNLALATTNIDLILTLFTPIGDFLCQAQTRRHLIDRSTRSIPSTRESVATAIAHRKPTIEICFQLNRSWQHNNSSAG